MDILLLDLIFEARMYDEAIYNEDGSIRYIPNISSILNEFHFAEIICQNFSYFISDEETIYQNMITSYQLHPDFLELERRNYVLGMTYVKEFTNIKKEKIQKKKEMKNLVNKNWEDFQNYVKSKIFYPSHEFIDNFSYMGILDQMKIEYRNSMKKKKEK